MTDRENQIESSDVHVVRADGREITLVGTAHISRESADLANYLLERVRIPARLRYTLYRDAVESGSVGTTRHARTRKPSAFTASSIALRATPGFIGGRKTNPTPNHPGAGAAMPRVSSSRASIR